MNQRQISGSRVVVTGAATASASPSQRRSSPRERGSLLADVDARASQAVADALAGDERASGRTALRSLEPSWTAHSATGWRSFLERFATAFADETASVRINEEVRGGAR
jgi:hypothetical protein